MTDTSLPGATRLPHFAYAEAVAYCDGGPDGAYAPDEWNAYRSETGLLCAMFYYRRTGLMTVTDRYGDEHTLPPVVDGQAWPHGLALSWDEIDGWTYAPLEDEFGTVGEHWESLSVPRLAAPASLRALLPRLLEGHEYDLPASIEEWQEPRAETLADMLATADAGRRSVDPRCVDGPDD